MEKALCIFRQGVKRLNQKKGEIKMITTAKEFIDKNIEYSLQMMIRSQIASIDNIITKTKQDETTRKITKSKS